MRCAVGLVCFAAGVLITGFGADNRPVRAGNTQVFELNVYHAVPGKVPKLEERFRDTSKLLAKHDLTGLRGAGERSCVGEYVRLHCGRLEPGRDGKELGRVSR